MLKKLSLLAVLVLSCQSSYSESITPYYGQTGNAALGANRWIMDNILPDGIPGVDINTVIYNYTIHKNTADSVDVYVQNENASGTGYIFREKDSWLPGSLDGTRINKAVPVVPTNRSLWGDGSIEVDGPGSVSDANVIYNYRVDPCYNPQFDPNCPGYQKPVPTVVEIDPSTLYNVFDDENVNLDQTVDEELIEVDEEKELSEEELALKEKEEKKDRTERLEKALAEADNSAMFANAFAQSRMLAIMNNTIGMQQQYSQVTIPGGEYRESISLDGGNIPDNKQGRRLNLASDRLHKDMVDMQY
jgi:hypothetical protein